MSAGEFCKGARVLDYDVVLVVEVHAICGT
jgi:hypothetical protein